ncbi:tyrosine-type recombinase/integrase [Corynebacterium uterequi]|uniref:tyrosine-type recombinase/integrase n=1 Tax=Corynebacterium uterequi TaxID=1072256 RepID=UPI001EEF0302|nr:tyrosine-type recombinase/integrase [Corynebacterium uterequi]
MGCWHATLQWCSSGSTLAIRGTSTSRLTRRFAPCTVLRASVRGRCGCRWRCVLVWRLGCARVRDGAGVDSRVHFHSLRHLFASRLLAGGVDLATVSGLLGHASVAVKLG